MAQCLLSVETLSTILQDGAIVISGLGLAVVCVILFLLFFFPTDRWSQLHTKGSKAKQNRRVYMKYPAVGGTRLSGGGTYPEVKDDKSLE